MNDTAIDVQISFEQDCGVLAGYQGHNMDLSRQQFHVEEAPNMLNENNDIQDTAWMCSIQVWYNCIMASITKL
jgi:hypothetical protein